MPSSPQVSIQRPRAMRKRSSSLALPGVETDVIVFRTTSAGLEMPSTSRDDLQTVIHVEGSPLTTGRLRSSTLHNCLKTSSGGETKSLEHPPSRRKRTRTNSKDVPAVPPINFNTPRISVRIEVTNGCLPPGFSAEGQLVCEGSPSALFHHLTSGLSGTRMTSRL